MITEWLVTKRGRFFRWIAKWWRHCDVHPDAKIGKRFKLGHGGFGVVIGACDIGDDVVIMHGTTLANKGRHGGYPTIENDAFIGCNCDLIGEINIGSFATIGAGSTITKDVKAYSTVCNENKVIVLEQLDIEDEK